MDISILKEYYARRVHLSKLYPGLIGRHNMFNENVPLLERGIELVERLDSIEDKDKEELANLGNTLVVVRNNELASHRGRIATDAGNLIHEAETELYSMALDVFKTYGE